MNKNGVSVIIVTYNTRDLIGACLESALANIDPARDEVVVVDNQSTDGTPEAVRNQFSQVHLVESGGNLGFSKACNLGASRAKGDYFLFMNGDVRLKPGAIPLMRTRMDNDDSIAALSGLLTDGEGNIGQMTWGWDSGLRTEFLMKMLSPGRIKNKWWAKRLAYYLQRGPRPVPFVTGACMMNRRAAFERVGGWDPQFELYFEDGDLCRRYRDAGYKVFFDPEIRAEHDLGQSAGNTPLKISLIYRQSQLLYYRKHNTPVRRGILKLYLRLKFLLSPAFWVNGRFRRALGAILSGRRHFTLSDDLA